MLTAALFTTAKTWNKPKCPLMINWTRKMWHIYTMEYYAAIKNDEFVSFVGTWIWKPSFSANWQEQKNQTLHVLTHRQISNNENTGTQGGEHHTVGSVGGGKGGITWGEMPDIGDEEMEAANCIAMYVPMQQSCMICTCTPEPKVQLEKTFNSSLC